MKKLLLLSFIATALSANAFEISELAGEHELSSGNENCYTTLNISIENDNEIQIFGDYDRLFIADLAELNNESYNVRDSGSKGSARLLLTDYTLHYSEKGRQSLSEDGFAIIPYKLNVDINYSEGLMALNVKSFNILEGLGRFNMSCLYTKK